MSKLVSYYLTPDSTEVLDWAWFEGRSIYRVGTAQDGSCFFHAVLSCISDSYRNRSSGGIPLSRTQLVRNVRMDLASELKKRYHLLSRGELSRLSKTLPRYSLSNMSDVLINGKSIEAVFFELVSDVFKINIYVLDYNTKDVYILGDDEIYRKDRKCIVLLSHNNHYEYIAFRLHTGVMYTMFEPSNEFINLIRQRELEKSSK